MRKEIEKNAKAINCTHILGYREYVNVCDSVMILSAKGTAIKVKKIQPKRTPSILREYLY